MASPQKENGYTEIANEILEHLALLHLSANQWQVVLCIIRKTYGFHKKVDYIANSQLCEATGLCKAVVSRALHYLEANNIISRRGKTIGIQKDWEHWQELAEQSTLKLKLAEQSIIKKFAIPSTLLAEQSTELAGQSTKVSSCAVAQKIKETITKDTIQKKDYISPLPAWIDKDAWKAYMDMRRKQNKAPTEWGKHLLILELERLKADGQDVLEVLNQSTMRCYAGVFEVKGGQNGAYKGRYQTRKLPKIYKTPEEHFKGRDG